MPTIIGIWGIKRTPKDKNDSNSILNPMNRPGLHHAALMGDTKVVKLFLKSRPNLELRDNYGETALTLAASKGRAKTVSILLNAGANINVKNNDGLSAFDLARKKGHSEVLKILEDAGAET